jgi:hypothetical protein
MLGAAVLSVGAGVGLAVPASASTDVTLPGCYGAGGDVYCEITLHVEPPVTAGITGTSTIPVCVVVCVDVDVPVLSTNLDNSAAGVCVTATDQAGSQNFDYCLDLAIVVGACGSNLGYHIVIGDLHAVGCEAFVPAAPRVEVCLGSGGFYYHDDVTHLTIGNACLA